MRPSVRITRSTTWVISSETGALGAGASSPETRMNVPPVLRVMGDTELTARVGQPLMLVAEITDDGLPSRRGAFAAVDSAAAASESTTEAADSTAEEEKRGLRLPAAALRPPSRVTVGKRTGLHLSWFVYRGTDQGGFRSHSGQGMGGYSGRLEFTVGAPLGRA